MKKLWKDYNVSLVMLLLCVVFLIFSAVYDPELALIGTGFMLLGIAVQVIYTVKFKRRLLKTGSLINDGLSASGSDVYRALEVPVCLLSDEGEILWFNQAFRTAFSIDAQTPLITIKTLFPKPELSRLLGGGGVRVRRQRQYFAVYTHRFEQDGETSYIMYLFDESRLRIIEKEYNERRICVMLTLIDNADEIYQNFKESDCAAIFGGLEQMIDDWASGYGALCRKFSNARMMIIVEEKSLGKMIADGFTILQKVRMFKYKEKATDVTLSIGVGKEQELSDCNESAKQALDMAQSRGGDQVAVRKKGQYKFYGGISEGFEKRNKVKTRLISKSIADIIKNSGSVVVMGHRFSDFDCFGAAVGIYSIARHFGVDACIAVNYETSLAKPIIKKFAQNGYKSALTDGEHAASRLGENSLLVVVDTHKRDFTEYPFLVDKAQRIMVIDHHRKSTDFIENTVMFYHMPNSSSASEMVTEIAQYVDAKPFITALEAQALFAGIFLDTRNFIIRCGVRTFEAAAYLKGRNANTVEVKKLFSNDMDVFRNRNAVIDNAKTYKDCFAYSVADNISTKEIRLVTSQAADEMLNIEGIKASFVLYKNGGDVNISARSFSQVNVQLIMESLGGGGHQAMSACQIPNTDFATALEKLKKSIDFYVKKYMTDEN